jgi:tetratricopeptide (TPR) repeat protein
MAFWKKILGSDGPKPIDYYEEGKDLFAAGKFHEALTSFRLALKASPGDVLVLQEIAMCYTRIGMTEEAAKTYRHVLQKDPDAAGRTTASRSFSCAESGPRNRFRTWRRFWRARRGTRGRARTSNTRAGRWRSCEARCTTTLASRLRDRPLESETGTPAVDG